MEKKLSKKYNKPPEMKGPPQTACGTERRAECTQKDPHEDSSGGPPWQSGWETPPVSWNGSRVVKCQKTEDKMVSSEKET